MRPMRPERQLSDFKKEISWGYEMKNQESHTCFLTVMVLFGLGTPNCAFLIILIWHSSISDIEHNNIAFYLLFLSIPSI